MLPNCWKPLRAFTTNPVSLTASLPLEDSENYRGPQRNTGDSESKVKV
jgi:hypothetical protein